MAYIQREATIAVPATEAWDALRDVGQLHRRLVCGFVIDCEFDGQTRLLKFANGVVASERMVSLSDEHWRVSWSATSDRLVHHNASAQVVPIDSTSCRVMWSVDLLPDTAAAAVDAMVQAGLNAMKITLERRRAA